ncbi:MAG: hypothetical protein E6R14_02770 [Thermomicrobiales bacterium]|nr:MAG: hypothetical protein E6R14_02770 [Thermomicrobiales bacterium]
MQLSLRAGGRLIVVLTALLATLATSLVAVTAQTPASNTYVSEQFGYQVTWPSDWTYLVSESEPGGFDMVALVNGDATAYIIFSRPGDTPLSEIAEFMIDGPPSAETFVPGMTELDTEGNEIEGETADRAWVAYAGNLAGEDVDGFTQFRYGEVRRLEGDLGVGLSLAMPAGDFDGDIAPYSALLDGVANVGGTPVAI